MAEDSMCQKGRGLAPFDWRPLCMILSPAGLITSYRVVLETLFSVHASRDTLTALSSALLP